MNELCADLVNLGYDGQYRSLNNFELTKAFNKGPPNVYFIDIVSWLCSQLNYLCDLRNHVNSTNEKDSEAFRCLEEISSLLNELNCPIQKLTNRYIKDRFLEAEDKIVAIKYICQELEAEKILSFKKMKKEETTQTELSETKTAKMLREILISLGYGKHPEMGSCFRSPARQSQKERVKYGNAACDLAIGIGIVSPIWLGNFESSDSPTRQATNLNNICTSTDITSETLFGEVKKKLKTLCQSLSPKDIVGELLISVYLSKPQWIQLEKLYQDFYTEYKNRRHMLITRLDVTVNSFVCSDSFKSKAEEIMNVYNNRKSVLNDEPSVIISDVLAATSDLAIIDKTSSASVTKKY